MLAADRVGPVLGEPPRSSARPTADEPGRTRYERPFDWLPAEGDGWRVVAADFVTVDDGSGIVHLAPAFGEIDREVGEAEGLPDAQPGRRRGPVRRRRAAPSPAGSSRTPTPTSSTSCAAADRLVLAVAYEHSYPHCWRCGTPLIYWAKPTWFAAYLASARPTSSPRTRRSVGTPSTSATDASVTGSRTTSIGPSRATGSGARRSRCGAATDCDRDTCIGSVAELGKRAGQDLTDLDLHRPFVDDVTIPCDHCGGRAVRVEPVLDAWFDSGSMPAAQWHYPFENQDSSSADSLPTSSARRSTRPAAGSTRCSRSTRWSSAAPPYRDVVCLALLLDQDGQKMSKSRGNVVDPWSVLTTRGADALRWNFAFASSPWTPKRVYLENIDETTNRFLVTLWNTYVFFVTYANLDGWQPTPRRPRRRRTRDGPLDPLPPAHARSGRDRRRSRSSTPARHPGARRLVDDLSNWYVRRSRPRFWKASDAAAHAVLHECLATDRPDSWHPFCPFTADALYQNLARTTDRSTSPTGPTADETRDRPRARSRDGARTRARVARSARRATESKLKVRQPLPRAIALVRRRRRARPRRSRRRSPTR